MKVFITARYELSLADANRNLIKSWPTSLSEVQTKLKSEWTLWKVEKHAIKLNHQVWAIQYPKLWVILRSWWSRNSHPSWNVNGDFCVYKSLPLDCILSQLHPVHTLFFARSVFVTVFTRAHHWTLSWATIISLLHTAFLLLLIVVLSNLSTVRSSRTFPNSNFIFPLTGKFTHIHATGDVSQRGLQSEQGRWPPLLADPWLQVYQVPRTAYSRACEFVFCWHCAISEQFHVLLICHQ
jgi:hypothetical protein